MCYLFINKKKSVFYQYSIKIKHVRINWIIINLKLVKKLVHSLAMFCFHRKESKLMNEHLGLINWEKGNIDCILWDSAVMQTKDDNNYYLCYHNTVHVLCIATVQFLVYINKFISRKNINIFFNREILNWYQLTRVDIYVNEKRLCWCGG